MKIVFTGGGTGGHFYPIIAVAEKINEIIEERKLINVEMFFFSDQAYDEKALFKENVEFVKINSGKWRRYFSLRNFTDSLKIAKGMFSALWQLYSIYPDIVFSKGGYASLPTVWAARILRIPIFIHESDSRPGRVSLWSARFAKRIAVSYESAIEHFKIEDKGKIAVTGNPIRALIQLPLDKGAREFLNLSDDHPVIFITGGSQGAMAINDVVLDILPQLLERYNVIHQVGKENMEDVKLRSQAVVEKNQDRYKLFDFLNESAMRMVAGVSRLAISRAGSFIFELAIWGTPSIIIPIPEVVSHDQSSNAFAYARTGAAVVIEQENLLSSVLLAEINHLMDNSTLLSEMSAAAKQFARPGAARKIGDELVNIALTHEK